MKPVQNLGHDDFFLLNQGRHPSSHHAYRSGFGGGYLRRPKGSCDLNRMWAVSAYRDRPGRAAQV